MTRSQFYVWAVTLAISLVGVLLAAFMGMASVKWPSITVFLCAYLYGWSRLVVEVGSRLRASDPRKVA